MIEELAILAPLEYQEKIKVLTTNYKEKVFDKEKICYFVREILLSPPSMRFPLCSQQFMVFTDENYD